MEAIVQKWGNSNAIRIPKLILKTTGIKENDVVELTIIENGFSVKKETGHVTLAERLESFYNKPVDEIGKIGSEEFDWGDPVGDEIW